MKKIIFFLTAFLLLQSCSINSEITYYKDATTTSQMDFDLKELMSFTKSMRTDSLEQDGKFNEIEKMPKTWTSFYDIEKKDGKKTKNEDSIRLMKKMFVKSNYTDKDFTGISFKMLHMSKKDFDVIKSSKTNEKIPVDPFSITNWDGKTLVINTENFNTKEFQNMMAKESGKSDKNSSDDETGTDTEQSAMLMQMMKMKISNTLKFENKIKSITGKHDWVQKIDDNTLTITYDSEQLGDISKLKNKDKLITVVTE